MFIIIGLTLTSCSNSNGVLSKVKEKISNLDKAECYDKETNSIKIGCKK